MTSTSQGPTIHEPTAQGPKLRYVIVPLDEAPESARAVPIAVRFAERLGASVDLLSVISDPVHCELQRDHLSVLAHEVGEPVASSDVIEGDDIAGEIIDRARNRPGSTIVMGSHGPGRASGVWAESVAAELLAEGEPVVIVGPHAEAGGDDRPVVACLDGSIESEQVLAVAAQWADRLDVPLVLVMVTPTPLTSVPDTLPPPQPDDFDPEAVLQNAAAAVALHLPRLTVITRVVTYPWNVADALAIYLERHPTQLIAVATHIRDGWARLAHSSTTTHMVRQLTVPILVVPIETERSSSDHPASERTSSAHDPTASATPALHPGRRPFGHIIVPIKPDLTGARPAATVAKRLAAVGADLSLWTCHAAGSTQRAPGEDALSQPRAELLEALHPVRAEWVEQEADDVVDALVEYAASVPDSIICMETDAPGRLRDTLSPTITGQIIRWSPRLVVLIGPRCRPSPAGFSEVVGCVDGSLMSEAVAEITGQWAVALGCPARLLEVVDPSTRTAKTPSIVGRYIERLTGRTARRHGIAVVGETIDRSDVAKALGKWAAAHPSVLLVMASHGTGMSEHVLGGVITDVVRRTPTPIVVVPAHPAHPAGSRTAKP